MTMEAGKWYQVGTPFRPLDGSVRTKLSEVITAGLSAGDTLMILDPSTRTYKPQLHWVPEKNAWCDLPIAVIATPSSETLEPGQAVFIHKSQEESVTFSGKVEVTEVSFGSPDGNMWAQVAAVWPIAQALNDVQWTGLEAGDTLMILDPDSKTYKPQLHWVPEKNAWCDLPIAVIATPSSETLEPGQAVFINKASKGIGKLRAE